MQAGRQEGKKRGEATGNDDPRLSCLPLFRDNNKHAAVLKAPSEIYLKRFLDFYSCSAPCHHLRIIGKFLALLMFPNGQFLLPPSLLKRHQTRANLILISTLCCYFEEKKLFDERERDF